MKILKTIALTVAAILLLGAAAGGLAYALRTDPWGPIAGRQLTGEVVTTPVTDWSFSDAHMQIAVETRPDDPHSVTTVCMTHEGDLYVPARGGSQKQWTHHVLDDPRVRVKIGGKIYPGLAERVTDPAVRTQVAAAARAKYSFPDSGSSDASQDIWLFRITSAPGDVAAPGAP